MRTFVETPVPQPAVGTDFKFTPSNEAKFRLVTIRAKFTASAVVANRFPHLQITDASGNVMWEMVGATAVTASGVTTFQYTGGDGAPADGSVTIDGISGLPIPSITWPEGTVVQAKTTALDVGDQWSGVLWCAFVGDEYEEIKLLAEIAANIGH